MPVNPSLVESLFAPYSKATLLSEYWPDRTLSVHGDLDRLPDYLRSEALRRFDHLAARYHGSVSFGNAAAAKGTAIAKDMPAALLRQMGLSLYLPDLAAYVPGTDSFLRELELELGAQAGTARIGAFAAAAHNGVTSHFDAEEVISVQLEGEKRFYIAPMSEIPYPYGMQFGPDYEGFDDLYPQMAAGIPKVNDADFQCIEMRPGSVLFMPRGTWHRTEATATSYSVSIIVRQPAPFETVLEQLRLTLLRDPAWRRPLYAAGHDDEMRTRLAALLEDLPRASQTFSADDILNAALPEPARLARLDETSWLQRIPNARLLLTPPQSGELWTGAVRISRFDGGDRDVLQLQIPPNMLPVFQWLARQERPLRAGALAQHFAALPFGQIKTILDVLVRADYFKLLRHVPLETDG